MGDLHQQRNCFDLFKKKNKKHVSSKTLQDIRNLPSFPWSFNFRNQSNRADSFQRVGARLLWLHVHLLPRLAWRSIVTLLYNRVVWWTGTVFQANEKILTKKRKKKSENNEK